MEQRDEELQKGNVFSKTLRYLQRNGLKNTAYKVYRKLFRLEKQDYDRWRRENRLTEEEKRRQRETVFPEGPCFSILVPLYRTPEKYLRAMLESVLSQTYGNWELLLADGSGGDWKETEEILRGYLEKEGERGRIRYRKLEENKGIGGNTLEALSMAVGDYVVFLDHDDTLAENACFELAKAIGGKKPAPDFLYTDEDKMNGEGTEFREPHFKPEFNLYLLESMNYLCHLVCVKRTLALGAGGFDPAFEGAQDYDFVLRCTEQAERICHIPKVLYHWRSHENSTASRAESKTYAREAGKRALEEHLKRTGKKGTVREGTSEGLYHVSYDLPYEPLVSVLIPNKDHGEDLTKCLASLQKQSYQNWEAIVIENNSTLEETEKTYREWEEKEKRVRVIRYEGSFNYPAVNRAGAEAAKGEYLLLLNNDTEWIDPEGLRELLGYGMQPEVGITGAKLLYGDDTIQHAGIILGIGGVAGHAFQGLPRDERTYMWRSWCTQELSAVTGACLLVRKSVFEETGGMDEAFGVAFNDVDFCLRVREAGYRVVYNSEVLLYHYESKSRGAEDTLEKLRRFHREAVLFMDRHKKELEKGDPFYSPNLTLEWQDFSCRSREEEKKARLDEERLREAEKAGR